MSELDELRKKIDDIDSQMTALFEKRMDATKKVGEYKKKNGIPVFDGAREAEVLAKKEAMLKNPYLRTDVKDFFSAIMALSRRQQRELTADENSRALFEKFRGDIKTAREPRSAPRVVYQGVPGAYADEAAHGFFGDGARYDTRETWRGAFEALRRCDADYAVVPIENNSTGSINGVYDLLTDFGFYVVGEQTVKVEHCLCAPRIAELSGIRDVYSHEQGFFQCAEYIEKNGFRENAMLNTAAAAKYVEEQNDASKAAICSRRAAELYGLSVLAAGINTSGENYTRFFIVSPEMEIRKGSDKISVMFTLPNEPGALSRVMSLIALHGLNLSKLESRPTEGRGWEYRFFADIGGSLKDGAMDSVLYEMLENTLSLRVLGNYVKGA